MFLVDCNRGLSPAHAAWDAAIFKQANFVMLECRSYQTTKVRPNSTNLTEDVVYCQSVVMVGKLLCKLHPVNIYLLKVIVEIRTKVTDVVSVFLLLTLSILFLVLLFLTLNKQTIAGHGRSKA